MSISVIKRIMLQWFTILLVVIGFNIKAVDAANLEEDDPLQKLYIEFKGNIRTPGESKYSFEFCPDNTCDLFVRKNTIPSSSFGDFIYLYLYFFSDYYFLSDWRAKQEVTETMKSILNKRKYDGCHTPADKEKARCIGRYLSKNNRIKLYSIRYDENSKSVLQKNLQKIVNSP